MRSGDMSTNRWRGQWRHSGRVRDLATGGIAAPTVLRESGFATVRADGTRRLYAVDSAPLRDVDIWLERFRRFRNQRLDALGTELARGERERRRPRENTAGTPSAGRQPLTKSREDT